MLPVRFFYQDLTPAQKEEFIKKLKELIAHKRWLASLSKKEKEEYQLEQAIKEFFKVKGNLKKIAKKYSVSLKKLTRMLKEYIQNDSVQ